MQETPQQQTANEAPPPLAAGGQDDATAHADEPLTFGEGVRSMNEPPERAADSGETPGAAPDEVARAAEQGAAEGGEPSAVYDSKARQRIPVTLWQDDGQCDVVLVCEPLSDKTLANFVRMVAEESASEDFEDDDAGRQVGALNAACGWLFDTLMTDVEGFGEEGEQKPPDWRDLLFGPLEKFDVVIRAVFGVEVVTPPAAKKTRTSWAGQSRAVVTRLRVPFNARLIDVSHTLRRPDAKRLGEFAVLQARVRNLGKPDENLLKLAAGYDELHVSHEGYKGAVPPHHKSAAYMAHMTRQGAAVRKN